MKKFIEGKIESLNQKSESSRRRIMWISVVIIMAVLIVIWAISVDRTVKQSARDFEEQSKQSNDQSINEMVGDKANDFQKLLQSGATEESSESEDTSASEEDTSTKEGATEEDTLTPEQQSDVNRATNQLNSQ